MKRPRQITAIVLLLFSVFITRESLDVMYYTALGPGPGFFPFWLSVFLGLLAVGMLYQSTFKHQEPMPHDFFPSVKGWFRIGSIVLALAVMVMLMDILGYRLTMLIVYVFLFGALGRQNRLVSGAVALTASFGVFYVFVEWLKVPLPIGMFGV